MKAVYKRENGTTGVKTVNPDKTRTQQQFKDQCDVNQIIAKYKRGLPITHLARVQGTYADVSAIGDYHESMNKVLKAQDAFLTIPAELRNKLGNDPAQLIAFLNNPNNRDEAIKYGLLDPKKASTETKSDVTKPKNETKNETKNTDDGKQKPDAKTKD